jgi:hypothetical protein
MPQTSETHKPRQLPCDGIYREGWFMGIVRVEAIRSTMSGMEVDVLLLERLAHRVFISIPLDDLRPIVGQRWTCTDDSKFSGYIGDSLSATWLWNIDFREFILEDIISFTKKLNSDMRSESRFSAIINRIERTTHKKQFMESRERSKMRPRYRKPIRAKKVTDPNIIKGFDFDIFEEDGKIFRYMNGYRKTMHLL